MAAVSTLAPTLDPNEVITKVSLAHSFQDIPCEQITYAIGRRRGAKTIPSGKKMPWATARFIGG